MAQRIDKHLIAFTGPDGIGKTFQSTSIVDWLNNSDVWQAQYIKELNESNHIFSSIRNLVYELYDLVDIITLAKLIKINRYLVLKKILDHKRFNLNFNDSCSKYIYVLDRWNICTYCYLKAKGINEDICLSYLYDEKTIIPGLTIMLVGFNGAKRISNRENNNNMFEEDNTEFKVTLAETYINFDTSIYPGQVVKINNDQLTKEETQSLIRDAIQNYIIENL